VLGPNGRYFWVEDNSRFKRYDLSKRSLDASSKEFLIAQAPTADRAVFAKHREPRGQPSPSWHGSNSFLSKDVVVREWLRLASYDESPSGPFVFSPEKHRLAWGTFSGLVYVAELDALSDHSQAFEEALRFGN
jgi:hypothetical protein